MSYVVAYGHLCEQVDRCTCGGGDGPQPHEPGCGLEEIATIAVIRDLLAREGARWAAQAAVVCSCPITGDGPDEDCRQHGRCAAYGHPCHCGAFTQGGRS